MVKKLSPKQKKLASLASPKNKITGADFKKLGKKKKVMKKAQEMATSSSVDFEIDVAEYIEEAFERCGIEVRTASLISKVIV